MASVEWHIICQTVPGGIILPHNKVHWSHYQELASNGTFLIPKTKQTINSDVQSVATTEHMVAEITKQLLPVIETKIETAIENAFQKFLPMLLASRPIPHSLPEVAAATLSPDITIPTLPQSPDLLQQHSPLISIRQSKAIALPDKSTWTEYHRTSRETSGPSYP
ncbi:hypothetical protein QCA50_011233 [Cerrena zonata]